MAERCPHTTETEGSIPSAPTISRKRKFLTYRDHLLLFIEILGIIENIVGLCYYCN